MGSTNDKAKQLDQISDNTDELQNNQKNTKHQVSRHVYSDIDQLAQMFSIFTHEPYHYIFKISYQIKKGRCCDITHLYIHTRSYEMSLDNLNVMKRKNKQTYSEQQIWYAFKYICGVFGYLEDNSLTYGIINASNFILDSGRYLRINVKHLLPGNQHFNDFKITNYYSPQYIQCLKTDISDNLDKINKYKSQIFSVGLLMIEMCLVPQPKPKFYSSLSKQINWANISKGLETVKCHYSETLANILGKMVAQDLRNRADWKYLNGWIFRNNQRKFNTAPCIFGMY